MTKGEETAFHAGKLARLTDEREQASGSRARCPYRSADRVRAWKDGYQQQALMSQPKPADDPEADQRRAVFVSGIQAWLDRNK